METAQEEVREVIIEGYNDMYSVNENGEFFSKFNGRKQIKPYKLKRGYMAVKLSLGNRESKTLYAHRLIAIAFIPNPENKPQVNHINGIRNDNRVINLEWCTNKENQIHSFHVLKREPSRPSLGKFGKDNKTSKPVIQMDLNGNFIKEFESLNEVVRLTGFNSGNISSAARGLYEKCSGFKWKYKEVESV